MIIDILLCLIVVDFLFILICADIQYQKDNPDTWYWRSLPL